MNKSKVVASSLIIVTSAFTIAYLMTVQVSKTVLGLTPAKSERTAVVRSVNPTHQLFDTSFNEIKIGGVTIAAEPTGPCGCGCCSARPA